MWNEGTQAALHKYHELHSDITINGQFFVWDDYWNKLATSAAGKENAGLGANGYFLYGSVCK